MFPSSSGRAPVWRVAIPACAFAVGAALLAPATAASQSSSETPVLSLSRALRLGLDADPGQAGVKARLEASRAAARQAGVRPNPSLGVEVENFTGSGRFATLGRTEATVSYHQTYERGGKRQARTALAERETALVAARALVRRLDLARAMQLAFVDVQTAEAEVVVARERLTISQRAESEVARRVAGARDPLFAGARAQAELAQARIDLNRAEADARNARAALAAYWAGAPAFSTPSEGFEIAEPPQALASAAETPDQALLVVEREIAVARIALEQSRSVQDPTVSLGLRHLQNDGAVALVVGGTLPLGRHDTNRGAVDRARAERLAVEADIEALRLEREREIARLIARRAAAAAEVRQTDAAVIPNAERAVALVREGFNRGGFSYLDVLAAQRALIDARVRRIAILKAFHQDGASLDRLTGAHAVLASTETQP